MSSSVDELLQSCRTWSDHTTCLEPARPEGLSRGGVRGGFRYQRFEERKVIAGFGMPEDAESKAARGVLEGFHGAVGGAGGFPEALAEGGEALVVMRLHIVAVAEDRREARVGQNLDVVLREDARRLLMHVGADAVWDVLLEVATESDVQHLRAAANREDRQVTGERGLHQRELEVVPLAHDARRLSVCLLAVELRIEVGAPGEDDAVDRFDRLLDPGPGRDEQRRPAGARHRPDVLDGQQRRLELPGPERRGREVPRDAADSR